MRDTTHPEATCEACGNTHIVWFVANDLWNRVVGNSQGILCPVCFAKRAEAVGIIPTAWEIRPEPTEPGEQK